MKLTRICAVVFLLLISSLFNKSFAQIKLQGKVLTLVAGRQVSIGYASIALLGARKGILTDGSGNFKWLNKDIRRGDTLFISSIGYRPLKIPVSKAMDQSVFVLEQMAEQLENVVIKTYLNSSEEGNKAEVAGYFRGWSTGKTGGEIGRIIYIDKDEYKVEKIRFKVNNQCDTCLMRVHIRDLTNGLPDRDLIPDSISMFVKKLSFDDRFSEFDFTNYNLVVKNNKYIYVSLEVLGCNNGGKPCSLCMIGTEPGNYLYRLKEFNVWEESSESSLYIKIFYKY